jgi:hypothetical protein
MRIRRLPPTLVARFAAGAAALLAMALASASPMIYTATVVTDIKVGTQMFHLASVSITFKGDTRDITPVVLPGTTTQIPSSFCIGTPYTADGTGYFSYLTKGTAIISITSQGNTLNKTLKPGQVFVALDTCNGGIGIGSFTGPAGLEPAYPLAFTLGTAMVVAVDGGLTTPTSMSGGAWSCIGYPPTGSGNLPAPPNDLCISPDTYPLVSVTGDDIYVYMPYFQVSTSDGSVYGNHIGALNRGTFTIAPVIDE